MEVLYEIRGENLIVFLPEELDHHNSRMIMEQCDWYILANQLKNVIFNFMYSSGIGVILCRYKLVKKACGEITVLNINDTIDRIFSISGLYKICKKSEASSLTVNI